MHHWDNGSYTEGYMVVLFEAYLSHVNLKTKINVQQKRIWSVKSLHSIYVTLYLQLIDHFDENDSWAVESDESLGPVESPLGPLFQKELILIFVLT